MSQPVSPDLIYSFGKHKEQSKLTRDSKADIQSPALLFQSTVVWFQEEPRIYVHLQAREHGSIDFLVQVIVDWLALLVMLADTLTIEDHGASGTPQGFVSGCGHYIRKFKWRWHHPYNLLTPHLPIPPKLLHQHKLLSRRFDKAEFCASSWVTRICYALSISIIMTAVHLPSNHWARGLEQQGTNARKYFASKREWVKESISGRDVMLLKFGGWSEREGTCSHKATDVGHVSQKVGVVVVGHLAHFGVVDGPGVGRRARHYQLRPVQRRILLQLLIVYQPCRLIQPVGEALHHKPTSEAWLGRPLLSIEAITGYFYSTLSPGL